jgi:hypothetical protein
MNGFSSFVDQPSVFPCGVPGAALRRLQSISSVPAARPVTALRLNRRRRWSVWRRPSDAVDKRTWQESHIYGTCRMPRIVCGLRALGRLREHLHRIEQIYARASHRAIFRRVERRQTADLTTRMENGQRKSSEKNLHSAPKVLRKRHRFWCDLLK